MERENLLLYFDVHPVSTPKPEKGKRRKLAQPGMFVFSNTYMLVSSVAAPAVWLSVEPTLSCSFAKTKKIFPPLVHVIYNNTCR